MRHAYSKATGVKFTDTRAAKLKTPSGIQPADSYVIVQCIEDGRGKLYRDMQLVISENTTMMRNSKATLEAFGPGPVYVMVVDGNEFDALGENITGVELKQEDLAMTFDGTDEDGENHTPKTKQAAATQPKATEQTEPDFGKPKTQSFAENVLNGINDAHKDNTALGDGVDEPKPGDHIHIDSNTGLFINNTGGMATVFAVTPVEDNTERDSSDYEYDEDEDDEDQDDSINPERPSNDYFVEVTQLPGTVFKWSELKNRQVELQAKFHDQWANRVELVSAQAQE